MIKSRAAKGKARVTFTVDPRVGAQAAAVCGEWNEWSADADAMHRDAEGGFSVTVDLDAGRAYRFRYLLDGQRWDNDWAADAYETNDFGGDDSVVDLTALAEAVPPAARRKSRRRRRRQRRSEPGGRPDSTGEGGTEAVPRPREPRPSQPRQDCSTPVRSAAPVLDCRHGWSPERRWPPRRGGWHEVAFGRGQHELTG